MTIAMRAITVLAAAGAGLLAAATTASAQDKVRFQTDWLPSGEHAMYYGGWQKGIFADEGIDVTITRGYGSGDTLTKLAGGAFDFVARPWADKMKPLLGSVVIENIGGGGSSLGAAAVATIREMGKSYVVRRLDQP